MAKRRVPTADPFAVWGAPPEIVLCQLGKKDHDRLRRYVNRLAKKVYRLAYDLGSARVEELRRERDALRVAFGRKSSE